MAEVLIRAAGWFVISPRTSIARWWTAESSTRPVASGSAYPSIQPRHQTIAGRTTTILHRAAEPDEILEGIGFLASRRAS